MMDYDFTAKIKEFGRVVFALILDKKRMTERVVIGRENETRRRLAYGGDEDEVYFDETRPLGSLLYWRTKTNTKALSSKNLS